MDKHDAGWRQQPVTKTNWQKVSEFITPTHPREHSRRMHQDRPVAGGPFHWCGNRRVKGREIPNKTQDARLAQSHVKVATMTVKMERVKNLLSPSQIAAANHLFPISQESSKSKSTCHCPQSRDSRQWLERLGACPRWPCNRRTCHVSLMLALCGRRY